MEEEIVPKEENVEEPLSESEGELHRNEESQRENDLHDRISRLEGYRSGFTASFGIIGLIIAIALAGLGWLGISGIINSSIESNVKASLESEIQQLLDDLGERQNQINDAFSRSEIAAGLAEESLNNSRNAASTAESALNEFYAVATAQSAEKGVGEWVVGFSSPTSLDQAIEDADLGIRSGYSVSIYKLGDFYVPTIGIYPTEDDAQVARLAILSSFARSTALYNLSVACPVREFFDSGFYGCYLEPTPSPTP